MLKEATEIAAFRIASRSRLRRIGVLGFALILAPGGFIGSAGAQTSTETRPSQTITVPSRSVDMPSGAAAPSEATGKHEAPRPRTWGRDSAEEPASPLRGSPTPPAPKQPQSQKAPSTNCQTNSATNFTPSDIHGAVGPTNLVVVTNVDVGTYDKSSCAKVGLTSLNSLFNAASGENYFDPQALWDNESGRFIITAESSFPSPNADQNQSFAVSKDSSGASWWVYKIQIIKGTTTFCVPDNTYFWDYPHVGSVNGQNPQWMITSNVFPKAASAFSDVITIDKGPTLTGAPASPRCFTNFPFAMTPANVLDSNSSAYLLSTGTDGGGSAIHRYVLNTLANTIAATPDIQVAAWSGPPLARQPNSIPLDTVGARFVSQTIQKGTNLWNVQTVGVGGFATGRVYQFSAGGTAPAFTKDLHTAANDHIFNVSIATSQDQAFVSATRTIPSDATNGKAAMLVFSGLNFTDSGWTSDLVATSPVQYDGTDCNLNEGCRWGDNSSTQIDPSNPANGWAFNQLSTGASMYSWTTRAALEAGPLSWTTVGTGDINADGKSDVYWRASDGTAVEWRMNGASVSASLGGQVIPNGWRIVAVGDVNGDGRADIIWRYVDGTVAIWLMNADGTIASTTGGWQVSTNWSVVGVGDFDHNGTADILWRNADGTVAIWEMNNAGLIAASLGGWQIPTSWSIAGVGDFDGNGTADILWRYSDGTVAIWEMNGGSVAASLGGWQIPTAWSAVGVGDFDGNGTADILWRYLDGTAAIWEMNGGAIPVSLGGWQVPTSWSVRGVGDFNGDARADILWRNTDETVASWFMNGGAILSTASYGAVP